MSPHIPRATSEAPPKLCRFAKMHRATSIVNALARRRSCEHIADKGASGGGNTTEFPGMDCRLGAIEASVMQGMRTDETKNALIAMGAIEANIAWSRAVTVDIERSRESAQACERARRWPREIGAGPAHARARRLILSNCAHVIQTHGTTGDVGPKVHPKSSFIGPWRQSGSQEVLTAQPLKLVAGGCNKEQWVG